MRENDTVHKIFETGHIGALDAERGIEDGFAQRSALFYLADDAFPNGLPHGGDPDHDSRSESTYISKAIAYRSVSERLDTPIASGHAVKRERDFHNELQYVGKWEEGEKVVRS